MSHVAIPSDFEPLVRESPYSDLTGPFHVAGPDGTGLRLGLRIEEKHLNNLGVAHGGILMTLADNAVGVAVDRTLGEKTPVVTVSLSNEFLNSAGLGDWVVAEARILKQGGRLIFVDCLLSVEDRPILHASAVMSKVRRAVR